MSLIRHVQISVGLTAAAVLVGAQGHAAAATLEVTASVPNACTVESGTLAFGTYQSGQTGDLTAAGQFNVQCTAPASVNVALDGGLNDGAGGNGRAMKGPGSDNFLDYSLYGPAGFGTPWLADDSLPFNVVTGANAITVNGKIDGNQMVVGGEYADTVQITLTFN